MPEVTLFHQDNREVLRDLIMMGVEVDSVVTDPPYFLESVVKRFGKANSAPAKEGTDGRFSRQSKGFMGKTWDGAEDDGTRIAFDPEFWSLVLQVLKPGGYVFAFSSARTGHWQAVAMEQAGFIMHPFHAWVFGSGFPKATSVSKGLDKAAGVEREVVGVKPGHEQFVGRDTKGHLDFKGATEGFDRPWMHDDAKREAYHLLTAPATEEAKQWDGWFYGTQSFKPAMEPIYMAQKPMAEKTGFANVLKFGTGAVNIDACRVPGEPWIAHTATGLGSVKFFTEGEAKEIEKSPHEGGRWPANVVHDGSEEVLACFPSGKGGSRVTGDEPSEVTDEIYGKFAGRVPFAKRSDSGSAARFFNCFPPDTKSLLYHPKANKTDRGGSKHPTVKPVALMQHLCRAITPPGGTILDPFAGSGTTGQAALNEGFGCILIEREDEYAADIRARFGLPSEEEAA